MVTCVRLSQLGYREKAWSVNKFAAVARRQGLPDTCVTILTKMYNYTRIEVQEAFAKVGGLSPVPMGEKSSC